MSDSDIVGRIVDHGEVDLFADLVARYSGYVFKIVHNHLPPEQVEETAHDVFIRCYRSLGRFGNSGSFKNWLSAIAVRTCYDFWRKKYRRLEVPVAALSAAHVDLLERLLTDEARHDFVSSNRRLEAREILTWALAKLSAADRMVLVLIHMEGHTCAEAAEQLGWSVANVKIRAFRSRNRLKGLLKDLVPDL